MNDITIEKSQFTPCIINLRGQNVILDRDVAKFYEMEPKQIKRNINANKHLFPDDFCFELNEEEKNYLISLGDYFSGLKFSNNNIYPYAFTNRGIYMLATILKTDKAKKIHVEIIRLFDELVMDKLAQKNNENESNLSSIILNMQQKITSLENEQKWNDERFETLFDKLFNERNKIGF